MTKEMKCHICETSIKGDEVRYYDLESGAPAHEDCLLRLAESIGDHRTAEEIRNKDQRVGRVEGR